MRRPTTVAVLERFMDELGRAVRAPVTVYFAGGVTALLNGWRPSTLDIDMEADTEEAVRAAARLKDVLEVNVEIAVPHHFIPALPGWQERSIFIRRSGPVSFFHYDPYGQALSKIERGHEQDMIDVRSMIGAGLVEPARLVELFAAIESELERYPAIDGPSFRRAVEAVVG